MKTLLGLAGLLLVVLAERAPLRAADAGDAVAIQVADDHIDFQIGTALVARYVKGPKVAKPYFWPMKGPGGVEITRGWPMTPMAPGGSKDHVHQKSVWFCHGDVIAEGIEVKNKIKGVAGFDFWSENPAAGTIVCTQVGKPKVDGKHGLIQTHNEWRTPQGTKILDEERTIHFYDFGAARLFVLDIDLHASVTGLTFGDTKEGSFGVRVNDVIRTEKGKGKLENAAGKTGEFGCWGQKSNWCDYSGVIDGKEAGIAILDDSANPQPACWHSRGYGLMAANPFGRARSGFPAMRGQTELVKLPKGEHLKLRYGVLMHNGDAKAGQVAEFYQKFLKLRGEK